jgi:hypothetical protein
MFLNSQKACVAPPDPGADITLSLWKKNWMFRHFRRFDNFRKVVIIGDFEQLLDQNPRYPHPDLAERHKPFEGLKTS